MRTLEEYVAMAIEPRRREIEAHDQQRRARWQRDREQALATAQANLALAIGERHVEVLQPHWTGDDNRAYAGNVWAEVRWRGHTVAIRAHSAHHIVLQDVVIAGECAPYQECSDLEHPWRTLLLYLADLPGRHGCGHLLHTGETEIAAECPACAPPF